MVMHTDQVSLTLSAIADPTRRAILMRLMDGEAHSWPCSPHSQADVAFNSGFGSLSSFYAAFTKRFNASPIAFRSQRNLETTART